MAESALAAVRTALAEAEASEGLPEAALTALALALLALAERIDLLYRELGL